MEAIREFINPFMETLGRYMPNVFGAIVVLVVGWILAYILSQGVQKLLGMTKLDERLGRDTEKTPGFERFFTKLVYYVLLLVVFLIVLDILGVEGGLDPLRNMVDRALVMFPNFLAALLIGVLGYILAKMLATAVEALAGGFDSAVKRIGVSEEFKLSRLLGQLVFIVVFIPLLIAALDTLRIQAISVPATQMLRSFMLAVPDIVAAGVIIAVAYFLGRFVAGMAADLLKNMGANALPEKMHVKDVFSENYTLSKLAGHLLLLFIMLAALISAAERLAMPSIAALLTQLTAFAGQVLLGVAILAVGAMIADVAYRALNRSQEPQLIAVVAKYAIIGLVLAVGLRAMGVANAIIELAFGLSLGAVAVAVAVGLGLSFGLGGREAAGKQMEHWLQKLRKDGDGSKGSHTKQD